LALVARGLTPPQRLEQAATPLVLEQFLPQLAVAAAATTAQNLQQQAALAVVVVGSHQFILALLEPLEKEIRAVMVKMLILGVLAAVAEALARLGEVSVLLKQSPVMEALELHLALLVLLCITAEVAAAA
tara:strand:- start:472 stop:861 length:390 start_codon:yes stop_codon:yes gene_type:complete